MKTISTLKTMYAWMVVLLVLTSLSSFSQPDYIFKNSLIETGKDREVGTRYRFPNVKPGFDALVTIDFISDGISIIDFDDNKNGGFDEAFQPRIQAKSNTRGYAEFTISFVNAGTSKPAVMAEVPAASIDIDGSGGLSEFDEYLTPGTYWIDYDMIGAELKFTYNAGSIVGENVAGKEKASIDTVAREAMFGMIYPNISSFTVRIGLNNQMNGATTRQRSVYFKRFFFANSFLPIKNLKTFTGNRKQDNKVQLNWTMNAGHEYINASIEKSLNGTSFTTIGETGMTSILNASFIDQNDHGAAAYFRLKMTDKSGKISYSTILFIRGAAISKIGIYPSMVQDNTTISYQSAKPGLVSVNLVDLNGRTVMQKSVQAEAGQNSIALNGLAHYSAGQYVVVLRTNESINTQRIQITK